MEFFGFPRIFAKRICWVKTIVLSDCLQTLCKKSMNSTTNIIQSSLQPLPAHSKMFRRHLKRFKGSKTIFLPSNSLVQSTLLDLTEHSAKRQHFRAFTSISVGIFRVFSTFYVFLLFSSGIAEININLALLDPVCFTKVCLVILKCMEKIMKWNIKGFCRHIFGKLVGMILFGDS